MIRVTLLCALLLAGVARAEVPVDPDWAATTAAIVRLAQDGEGDAAMREGQAALRRARADFGDADPRTAEILTLVAELHMTRGEWAPAERLLLEGMAIRDAALPELDWAREESRNLLGAVYAETGRLDEAERSHRWAAAQATKAAEAGLVGPNAPRWVDVPSALDLLARHWHKHGQVAKLPALHAEILDAVERWGGRDTGLALERLDAYPEVFQVRKDSAGAQRALDLMERFAAADVSWQARVRLRRASVAASADDDAAAAGHFLAAWPLADRALPAGDPGRVAYICPAAAAAVDADRESEAEAWLREALRIADTAPEQVGTFDLMQCQATLAGVLEGSGRHDEAVPLRRALVLQYREIYGDDSWMVANALSDVATALALAREVETARATFGEAYRTLLDSGDAAGWLHAYILDRWLVLDLRVGDLGGAAARWSEVVALRARAGAGEGEQGELARRERAALYRAAGRDEPAAERPVAESGLSLPQAFRSASLLDLLAQAERDAGPGADAAAAARLTLAAELALDDGNRVQAVAGYDKALSIQIREHGAGDDRTRATARRLAVLHREAGRDDLAGLVLARVGLQAR